MQQLAEAAQAHAAEAMRLQAMAACLQAQGATATAAAFGAGTGLPLQYANAPYAAAAQGCGFPGPVAPFALGPGLGTGIMSTGAASTGPSPGLLSSQRGRGAGQRQGKGRGGAQDTLASAGGQFPRAGGASAALRAQIAESAELDTMSSAAAHFQLMGGAPGSYLGQVTGGKEPDGTSLASAAAATAAAMAALPPEGAFMPSEPAQINPMSLRSLSSCSLVDLAKAESEASGPAQGHSEAASAAVMEERGDAPGGHARGWTVKNTFLDFEATPSPPAGRLRSICSAAGRLNALAEGSTSTSPEMGPEEEPGVRGAGRALGTQQLPPAREEAPPRMAAATAAPQWSAGQFVGHAASGGSLRMATSGTTPAARGVEGTLAASGGTTEVVGHATDTEADTQQGEDSEAGGGANSAPIGDVWLPACAPAASAAAAAATARSGPPLLTEGITVKNTFLEYNTQPAAALRAVHTAAGRLDLLVQDDGEEE